MQCIAILVKHKSMANEVLMRSLHISLEPEFLTGVGESTMMNRRIELELGYNFSDR